MSDQLRIGVDVGGTNTDAVLVGSGTAVLAKVKTPTTSDIATGIRTALDGLITVSGREALAARRVMVGSTVATNAIIERRGLERVALVRIGAPSSTLIRPLFDWPADLYAAVVAGSEVVAGGAEYDGSEIRPLDTDAVRRFAHVAAGRAAAVAVSGVFSNVAEEHELRAAEAIREEAGDELRIYLSHELASVGLLERESATVLNGALGAVAQRLADAVGTALDELDLDAQLMFTQNDGTLVPVGDLVRRPILTVGSGPANSLRGAAVLAGLDEALVADVGGTSTDVGALRNGFPRESSAAVEIGGVRTNSRMPDILAIALGGGSVIGPDGSIGPESVGSRISERALVFGGEVPTMTDASVAGGRLELGTHPAPPELLRALRASDTLLADLVDRMRVSSADIPLVAVGGGSHLIPERIAGISAVVRPQHHDVANAIGASIASVAGEVDRLYRVEEGDRDSVLEEATQEAIDGAVAAGADAAGVQVVMREETPLAYLASPTVRLRVKAAGPLRAEAA